MSEVDRDKTPASPRRRDHMSYWPAMEVLPHDMMEEVISRSAQLTARAYEAADVQRALERDVLTVEDFAALLSPAALPLLEQIASRAKQQRERYFGVNVAMFTPLYISNYCENWCSYCGFNCKNKIRRARLSEGEMLTELQAIAASGIEELLILTGESHQKSSVTYIGEAVKLARRYFRNVGLEVYPVNTQDYRYLHECGTDYITIFQETYHPDTYERYHLAGHKRVFPYRFHAQERALRGGMRGVAFAALLGLDDYRRDALATGLHAHLIQRRYPHAELSLSCPRLRPTTHDEQLASQGVGERQLMQIICAYRLFLPYANITISSRERAEFRDHIVRIAATKISAGVHTGVGEHQKEEQGDEQFEIADPRTVQQIYARLKEMGMQPVMNDYA